MQNIWGRRTETGPASEEFREQMSLHLLRHIGEPHVAFSDTDGWAGKSREAGPPVDVMVVPPEGERRFAYVCTFGCSLKKAGDAMAAGGKRRMEFVLAAKQTGESKADLAALNLTANAVRQFAKLAHLQPVRVTPGETVQFAKEPKPMFEGSKHVAFAFMSPRLPADGFDAMRLQDGELVTFVAPVPIYRAELEMGRRKGPDALSKAMKKAGLTEMVDLARQPVAKTGFFAKLAGLFRRD